MTVAPHSPPRAPYRPHNHRLGVLSLEAQLSQALQPSARARSLVTEDAAVRSGYGRWTRWGRD